MPYRRLPKTDQARLHALQKALRQAESAAFNDLAINYKTRTEAQRLLMQYENQVAQYHANFDSKVSANRQYRHRVHNARMYVSHFIQVLNLAVIRGEIKRSQKELYEIKTDFELPMSIFSIAYDEKILNKTTKEFIKLLLIVYDENINDVDLEKVKMAILNSDLFDDDKFRLSFIVANRLINKHANKFILEVNQFEFKKETL